MKADGQPETSERKGAAPGASNRAIAATCAGLFALMVGVPFASAPLYAMFCRVTGYGGTTQVAESYEGIPVLDREIKVRFDANVSPDLPWEFTAEEQTVRMRIGEMRTVKYRARNISARETVGTSTYNVTPDSTGAYFSKIACFCFTQQVLKPGEDIEMGVTFYVDPAIVDDPDANGVPTITLSYTFFPAARPEKPLAAVDTTQKPTL